MKKIQKLLSLLLAIIMLAGALAGCAGGEKPAADTPKNGQTDEQTPAVWLINHRDIRADRHTWLST